MLHARFSMLFYVYFKIGKKTRLLFEKLLYNLEFGIEIENFKFQRRKLLLCFKNEFKKNLLKMWAGFVKFFVGIVIVQFFGCSIVMTIQTFIS